MAHVVAAAVADPLLCRDVGRGWPKNAWRIETAASGDHPQTGLVVQLSLSWC